MYYAVDIYKKNKNYIIIPSTKDETGIGSVPLNKPIIKDELNLNEILTLVKQCLQYAYATPQIKSSEIIDVLSKITGIDNQIKLCEEWQTVSVIENTNNEEKYYTLTALHPNGKGARIGFKPVILLPKNVSSNDFGNAVLKLFKMIYEYKS